MSKITKLHVTKCEATLLQAWHDNSATASTFTKGQFRLQAGEAEATVLRHRRGYFALLLPTSPRLVA